MQTPRRPVSHWRPALSLPVKVKFMTAGSGGGGVGRVMSVMWQQEHRNCLVGP